MKHSISNSFLKVDVLSVGTEISSIQSLKTGLEYMWNANPDVWGSHAPVLFPAIGSFKNNVCTIAGVQYEIPKHGFVRYNDAIQLISSTATSLEFLLDYSEESLKIYPYKFKFTTSFRLEENKLTVSHQVENLDDKEINFCLGGHPAFKCPVNKGEVYEDYYLEFEKEESAARTLLSDDGLISGQTAPILNNTKVLPLSPTLFKDDALIFKDLKSRSVSLKSHQSNQILTVNYKGFPYLGIWAKPNAPFVCIEPWIGIADHEHTDGDFMKKDKLISLQVGKIFSAEYSITIDE